MEYIDKMEVKFDEKGLVPAIVVDDDTDRVLTLAYMNEESLNITLEEKRTCFWSRSRKELWRKGETSGNVQHVVSITADCDRDALLVRVKKEGPACHLGNESCFEFQIAPAEPAAAEAEPGTAGTAAAAPASDPAAAPESFSLKELYGLLQNRKSEMPEGSYTSYLFEKGMDKILKKIGEEGTEVIIAAKAEEAAAEKKETIYEIADLAYHVMVLMVEMGISTEDILSELASRHVIDKKVKQEKMV